MGLSEEIGVAVTGRREGHAARHSQVRQRAGRGGDNGLQASGARSRADQGRAYRAELSVEDHA